ncbi:hypothetical protein T10_10577 [Trichinella papuae]|uniref:Uncharacterized protein n=1 Tax=Trichinella papuae TaxID=268474 RepID=A0A0V1MXH5_9BILA|nr:hypothetical protein T10_10577 [Trichinella papuae]
MKKHQQKSPFIKSTFEKQAQVESNCKSVIKCYNETLHCLCMVTNNPRTHVTPTSYVEKAGQWIRRAPFCLKLCCATESSDLKRLTVVTNDERCEPSLQR